MRRSAYDWTKLPMRLYQALHCRPVCLAGLVALSLAAPRIPLRAQTPAGQPASSTPTAGGRAAEPIQPDELARDIATLAGDSLHDPDTSRVGLERTARYVADRFHALGLTPGISSSQAERSWFQRYPVPGQLRVKMKESVLKLMFLPHTGRKSVVNEGAYEIERRVIATFTSRARFAPAISQTAASYTTSSLARFMRMLDDTAYTVLLAGRQSPASFATAAAQSALRDKIVLYVPYAGDDSLVQRQVLAQLYAISDGVIVPRDMSVEVAAEGPSIPMIEDYLLAGTPRRRRSWVVEVTPDVLNEFLAIFGTDMTLVRADSTPLMQPLPYAYGWLRLVPDTVAFPVTMAPNVVGVVEGTDSLLKNEYVAIAAPMKGQAPSRSTGGDSPNNDARNAESDGVSVAGLLALAKAFSQEEVRPRRSMIFLALSGADYGNSGSNFFIYASSPKEASLHNIVAAIVFDGLGQTTDGSITVDGGRHVNITPSLDWIVSAHPELKVALNDAPEGVAEGEYLPFVRTSIPSLHFYANELRDRPTPRDAPAARDLAQAVSVLRLIHYVGTGIVNADRAPRWNQEGRERMIRNAEP